MPRHLTAPQEGWVGRDREKMQVRVRGCGRSLLFQLKAQGRAVPAVQHPKSCRSPQEPVQPPAAGRPRFPE